jgi:hypothetical protein
MNAYNECDDDIMMEYQAGKKKGKMAFEEI